MTSNKTNSSLRVFVLWIGLWIGGSLLAQTAGADSLVVHFSPAGGFYDATTLVNLAAPDAEVIYYTLDGSQPSAQSARYNGPIHLSETAVVRAVAFRQEGGEEHGAYLGNSYFIHEPRTRLPVVSLAITPGVLFHPSRGIFVQGTDAVDSLWHKPGANFWTRREHAMHLEVFAPDGSHWFNSRAGMRLFGGMSRLFPQKSLAIMSRKRYGDARFKMPVFGEDYEDKFKFLVLRNSGSDFGKSHFRDAFMTTLVRDWGLETQASQPAQVYINGNYWGVYNIREKVNRYFIESHARDVHRDSIDLLEHYLMRKRGSRAHYQDMLNFLERYDLDIEQNYEYLSSLMEIDNFMQYQIAQVYFDNRDAGGNIKYWRPRTDEGRWRWILYDTDWGYGLHRDEAYRANSLAFHTEPNGPHWPNPPWSTYLLRKLLRNEGFRHRFINRFADHLNTSLSAETAGSVLDSFYLLYRTEIPRHLQRWRLRQSTWEEQVDIMRNFAEKRPGYLRDDLREYFSAGADRRMEVRATSGGTVLVNDYLSSVALNGYYFANYPVKLRAVPHYGCRFVGWEDAPDLDREVEVDLRRDRTYRYRARFEPYVHPLQDQIIISEVCPKSKKADDWIELHNRGSEAVPLAGWVLTDSRNEFRFPEQANIPANDFLVVCRDVAKFRERFPQAHNVIGGLGFGLNKRAENLGLYADLGAAVDSFAYAIEPPDTAFTLSLRNPAADNADFGNWELVVGNGSPNRPNPYQLSNGIRSQQREWLQMGVAAAITLLCLWWLRGRVMLKEKED